MHKKIVISLPYSYGIHLLWSPLYSRKSLPSNFFFPKNDSLVQDGCFYPSGSEAVIVPATDEVCTRYPLISKYFVLISAKTPWMHTKILSNSTAVCFHFFDSIFVYRLAYLSVTKKKTSRQKCLAWPLFFGWGNQ